MYSNVCNLKIFISKAKREADGDQFVFIMHKWTRYGLLVGHFIRV